MKGKVMLTLTLFLLGNFIFTSWTNKLNDSIFSSDDYIYDFVDEMPEFPGGEMGLKKYIEDNLKYPKKAKKADVSGVIYTECVIEKNGEVTNEKVYPGISKKMENAALKLIQKMPNWIPGKNKTKLVRVKLSIPINFELKP